MTHPSRPPAVLLMGPTASGKSSLAMELAQRLPVEIVSVDSAQVYRGMDRGTAKASSADRALVPHHLIDILAPTEAYSAARFRADALGLVAEIHSRGRIALLVGGTMLYFRALLEGLSCLPGADREVRACIDREASALGWPAMHARLAEVDPETAQRVKPRDSQRIQRALEIFRVTGQPMARLLAREPEAEEHSRFFSLSLMPDDRAQLHQRIEARFRDMLQQGLVEELAALRERYDLSPRLPSMRAVGYRQAWQHLDGEFDRSELKNRGVYATRQLAKRQMTWLRSWRGSLSFDCFDTALEQKVYQAVAQAAQR